MIGGEAQIEPFLDQGLPIVLASRINEALATDSVSLDNLEGSRIATRHLIDTGKRRIGFVGGRVDTSTNRDKLAGYLTGLREVGLEADPALVQHGDYTRGSGERAVQKLVGLGVDFDGLIAADDTIALGCLEALATARIDVPNQVGLVGFDDIDVASLQVVSLSTVGSEPQQLGRIAIELLLDRIEGRYAGPPRRVVVAPTLIVRRSSSANATMPRTEGGTS